VRLSLHRQHDGASPPIESRVLELDANDVNRLSTVFSPPSWLRDLGRSSWYLVGFFGLLIGLAWLLGVTMTIVGPVVAALILASITSPIVSALERRGLRRLLAAVVVLLALLALAVVVLVVVLGGITGHSGQISSEAAAAADKAKGWLTGVGVSSSGASTAKAHASSDVPAAISTLVRGVVNGIRGTASLVFGLSLALLSLFFMLKDGPSMRRWVDRHLGLPLPVAETITTGVLHSLRGYFRGVTLVAAFNGIVVMIGAFILGVPLAATIGLVTFLTAYVPFIGAFVAGAFAVVLALGAKGVTAALIMLVIVILANGLLQNVFQPFAMGTALDLHPLVVLVVTISAGCLFGMIGLVLAAPLTSAAVHIERDLVRARAAARATAVTAPARDPV
jgi:putative heme transporter